MFQRFARGACTAAAAAAGLAHAQGAAESERVRQIVGTICVACHGADGNSPEAANPKLAGLQAQYVSKQLKDYRAGNRRHEVMSPLVANMNLSDDEIEGLAAFFARQAASAGKVRDPSLLDAGRKVYLDGNELTGVPACAGCHDPDGRGTARFPRLAGQHPDYTLRQLKDFAAAKRENDRGLVMQSLALRMTEREMQAVSEYIASLP